MVCLYRKFVFLWYVYRTVCVVMFWVKSKISLLTKDMTMKFDLILNYKDYKDSSCRCSKTIFGWIVSYSWVALL